MAQFFGEYLVEKQLISEEDLLAALVEQSQSIPTYLEAAFKNKLLPAEKILSVLKVQVTEGLEFKSSCRHLNLWSPELEQQLDSVISKERIPLGKILLSQNKLEVKQLIAALDDFLADQVDRSTKTSSVHHGDSVSLDVVETTSEMSSSGREPQLSEMSSVGNLDQKPAESPTDQEGTELDELALGSYIENFNSEHFQLMEQLILGLEPTSGRFVEDLVKIRKEFDSLLGLAKLVGLPKSQDLLESALSQLERLLAHADSVEEKIVWEFKSACKITIDLLWDVRLELEKGSPENLILQAPDKLSIHNTLLQDWDQFQQKIS
ncbi:MAG: hypothetical protein KDD61_15955 [Bdellovibrionales bacterium]|nr:hypothetical protein [Bdellovibrionales bacterium]